jgi:hypothetical protein
MAYQANRTGSVAYFNGRDGFFSRLDAIQPVAMLIVALVEMNFVFFYLGSENLRIAGIQCFGVFGLGYRIA